jgi:hypothetical protein
LVNDYASNTARKHVTTPTLERAMPNGTPKPKCLNYRDLAWWAETADGYRDENLVIAEVTENGETRLLVKERKSAELEGNPIVVKCIRTETEGKRSRPAPSSVKVVVDGKEIDCRSKDGIVCDSIFCTDSAMEKFLFPYYHAQRLLTPEQWHKLMQAFLDPWVVIIGHVWPSRPLALGQSGDAEDAFYVLSRRLDMDGAPLHWESLGNYKLPSPAAAAP